MARYLETANDLRQDVNALIKIIKSTPDFTEGQIAQRIGHIINLTIRACPRGVQHTVRKNIVAEAVRDFCHVSMTEETDEVRGTTYHAIHITAK